MARDLHPPHRPQLTPKLPYCGSCDHPVLGYERSFEVGGVIYHRACPAPALRLSVDSSLPLRRRTL